MILLAATACGRQPADRLVLRGTVPGAMDSTEVALVPNGRFSDALKTFIVNEKFVIEGKFDKPTYCELRMDNYDICERRGIKDDDAVKYKEIGFFVENGELTFSTPSVDSLPESFWRYDARKERNYTVTGSAAQDAFFRYQQQTIPTRHAIREAGKAEEPDGFLRAQKAKEELDRAAAAFIRSNDNLAVNLHVAEQLKREPFTYDQAYLDELAGLFAASRDTCAPLREFREYLEKAAAFTQGKPLEDGVVLTPDGKEETLLAHHLRKMHEQYGEKVNFVSLSLDSKEADWQQAMTEEGLPWPQFLASKELSKAVGDLYGITAIPTFLLVDAEGRIVFSGHSSDELEAQLGKL